MGRPIPTECPACKATGDFVRAEGPKKMTLPKGQVSTLYICKSCTAILAEDVTYED